MAQKLRSKGSMLGKIVFKNDIELDEDTFYNIHNEALYKIKRKLNKFKRIIDSKEKFINNDIENNIIDWNKLIDCTNFFKNLKKIISWKFNAEFIDNECLSFYEIIEHEDLININEDRIKTLHLNEKSCSFILALNHYISTKTSIKNYQWYAQCFNYEKNFIGKINFRKLFPTRWLKDNNLTNLENIENYK